MTKTTPEALYSFDKFGRYALMRDIINHNRQKEKPLKILDVGGRGNILKKFLPKDAVYYLDPFVDTQDKNYIEGDGCAIPQKEDSFDWVVSGDVFEHIPKEKREQFLKENLRVAKLGVILAAPFDSELTRQAEKNADKNYKALMGQADHEWFREHLKNGLPQEEATENFIEEQGLEFQKINNNALSLWQVLQVVNFSTAEFLARNPKSKLKEELAAFNAFYNTQIYPKDHTEPSYRRVYFIKKAAGLADLPLNKEALNESLILEAFSRGLNLVDKINRQKSQTLESQKDSLERLEQTVKDREEELFAMKTSLRWKVPNYFYKLYKKKVKKFIPKLLFNLAAPLIRFVKRLQGSGFKPLLDVSVIQKLNFDKLEPLTFKKIEAPQVSIVIPVMDQWRYTYHCLLALQSLGTKAPSFEVIVVDNHSTDETSALFQGGIIKNVRYLPQAKNLGFGRACNLGAQKAQGEFVVFLNNDTHVQENWLKALVETFEKNPAAGLVGSKLIFPDGRLQEAGGIVWKDQNTWNCGGRGLKELENPNDYQFNYLKEVDFCSGASIMLRTKFFLELGGFDERYAPAYFEDVDLAFAVRAAQKKVFYQPLSTVIHFEGMTGGTDIKEGTKKYQEVNRHKFFEKWQHVINKENLKESLNNFFLARDRAQNQKIILFIDYMVPAYNKEAGAFIAFEYLKILKKLGYKIIFWPHNQAKIEPYTQKLQQLGIEVVYGNLQSFPAFMQQAGRHLDFVFVSRREVAQEFMDTIKKSTPAKVFYVAHDLHYLREERQQRVEKKNLRLKQKKALEVSLMQKADASLFFSPVEVALLREEFPDLHFATLPWIQPLNANKDNPGFANREGLLFIGSRHTPNIDGLRWFHKTIFPKIKERLPQVFLKAAGHELKEGLNLTSSKDFKILGFVPDLTPFFLKSRVFVAPLRFGAGIKGKILLAMSWGLPVVTTPVGAEGIGLKDEENALIAKNAEEFAKKTALLYTNPELWQKLAQNSTKLIQENFSRPAATEKIKKLLR